MRFLLTILLFCLIATSTLVAAVNKCIVCTLLVSLVEEVAIGHNMDIPTATNTLCNDVLGKTGLSGVCDVLLSFFVPAISNDYNLGLSPDYTCINSLNMCPAPYNQCKLFKKWPPQYAHTERVMNDQYHPRHYDINQDSEIKEEFLSQALSYLHSVGVQVPRAQSTQDAQAEQASAKLKSFPVERHLPEFDSDGDRFSVFPGLRGSDWRGKDCNDWDATVYPGRQVTSQGPNVDHNCNGIYGVDTQGRSYEDLFCSNSGARGLIALGDSATAHFRIPPTWFTGATFNTSTFNNLLPVATDELDWPQCSLTTNHLPAEQCPPTLYPTKSVYERLRERNRCNHRDYQNIGVNGASTNNMKPNQDQTDGVIISMKSRNGTDNPALVYFALIGNDVCNHKHSFDTMTTPKDFEANVLASLAYLEQNLAPNSYVVFSSLVDGRILYDAMHDKIHPVGIPYPDLYDYMNCIEVNPCWGWLNTNETVRNLTSARAAELTAVYSKIISEHNYNNFKMGFFDLDWWTMINKWVKMGHQKSDLIEPTDGFHPSQTANALLAEMLWEYLENSFPEAIGNVNPYNDQIQKIFGDQGGY